jgi:hypothetical protein
MNNNETTTFTPGQSLLAALESGSSTACVLHWLQNWKITDWMHRRFARR